MKEIILKIFSYNGEFNRKEYLLFGFLIPIIIVVAMSGFANLAKPIIGESTSIISGIGLLVMFSIVISSTLKRARATDYNTSVMMVIWILLTPIAMLYLIFSPNSNNDKEKSSNLFVPIIFVILILGILAAVAIPKLSETRQDAQKEQAQ